MDLEELPDLWARCAAGDIRARDQLVESYVWLARKIAHEKRIPSHIERDDVVSWALGGLLDAVGRFDVSRSDGALHKHFMSFASQRIRGAILDGLKSPTTSWASRLTWRRVKEQREAEDALSQELGKVATRADLAAHLGVKQADLINLRQQIPVGATMVGGEDGHGLEDLPAPDRTDLEVDMASVAHRIAAAIPTLPEPQQRLIVELFYNRRSVGEAAKILGQVATQTRRDRAESMEVLRAALQHV